MKLDIYIESSGLEQIATGNPCYWWNFSVREAGEPGTTGARRVLADLEVPIPSQEEAIVSAVNGLQAQATSIRAEAEQRARELDGRAQNLLALSYEASQS